MKSFTIVLLICLSAFVSPGQDISKLITVQEVTRIESVLASDEMGGRKTFTPSIEKAADFISSEFKKAGLQNLPGLSSFRQEFKLIRAKFVSATGNLDSKPVEAANIIAVTTDEKLIVNDKSGFEKITIDSSANLMEVAAKLVSEKKKYIVLVDPAHSKNFRRLTRFKRDGFEPKVPVVFVLTGSNPEIFDFEIKHLVSNAALSNVAGMLPGKSKKDEYVIFSAHYDHLGTGKQNAAGDSVYNGANDDAAGTTAVIALAHYFSKIRNNERTIIFAAFTAEEIGGYGSQYFSKQFNPDKITAMFNIEMIGTESNWGKNSAYITGHDKSDFGKILSENLTGTAFKFEPDPYTKENLFYRSDNATLAALGVPAHTISTSKMDVDKNYHTQEDEFETLDLVNMTEIIKAIAISSRSIISGKDTPSRVEKLQRN